MLDVTTPYSGVESQCAVHSSALGDGVVALLICSTGTFVTHFPSSRRNIVTGNPARSGRLAIGAAAGKITCVPSFLVCISPHPPERIPFVRWRPSACRRHAVQLPLHRPSMHSQQPAIVDTSAPGGIASVRRGIADIERSVAPHGVHDHRQLARHSDTDLAVAGAFGDRLAPVLDLVGALEGVISADAAS
ncbi:hypothetical protein RFM68_12805 [Mesorhizobium sp. MSK_1335]|uniref:Uncharacterized protein n=1 Tax=Mesorhizobium montanum TaxID=3072323 RepID=A0ABU4ZJ58_9HYPH|nr:hypothetical protein [Mesorhizobium sp. MSK_1335]MDX8525391.1 hypothetical protein [Mesorhizobium sp. MSK_1335]